MKTLFNRIGLVTLLCLTLLSSLLRPCAAQRPTLVNASWAGSNDVPALLVNVRGGSDKFFGASGADWTIWGRIARTDVTLDANGLHVAVVADVLYFPLIGLDNDLGDPVVATATLVVTFKPDGKHTEHVEVEGEGVSFASPELPIIRGSASLFWLP